MGVLAAIGEGLVELERDGLEAKLRMAAGGDAANIAVMASRLGADCRLAGRVGNDSLGDWLLSFWAEQRVDVRHVRIDPDARTGLYLNSSTPAGDHDFTYWRHGSAGSRLTPADLADALFEDLDMLVVTGVTLAVSASSAAAAASAVECARASGAKIACVLNYRSALGGDPRQLGTLAMKADLVMASREDAVAIFDESDPVSLAHGALGGAELVLTASSDPVVAVVDGIPIEQAVPRMPVVNAAGAGDALAGAYLARRLAGHPPSIALAWGVAASAHSVTRRGCAGSYPTLAEAEALLDQLPSAA